MPDTQLGIGNKKIFEMKACISISLAKQAKAFLGVFPRFSLCFIDKKWAHGPFLVLLLISYNWKIAALGQL